MRVVELETRHYARGSRSSPRKNADQPSTHQSLAVPSPSPRKRWKASSNLQRSARMFPPDSQMARPGGPPLPSFQGSHHAIVQRSNQFRQNLHQYPPQSTAFYLVYPSHGEMYQTP